ncbi:hypothetical protein [Flavobacterium aestivum]|uniref:hypothetical protein n=1 Tax=Flavobacterium aestivum TaxID=3003257 RepID=UPI0022857191|nr:hypothetical protein [Flavobacterium aestivum]
MKVGFKKYVFLLIFAGFSHVVLSQKLGTVFPQQIAEVYYQRCKGDSVVIETRFNIRFKKPLSANIQLQKIYFHYQEAGFELKPNTIYVAYFYSKSSKQDYIMDSDSTKEYGNKPPLIAKPKFDLKANEAVVKYLKNGKTYYYKITNVKELPMIVYPTMNK